MNASLRLCHLLGSDCEDAGSGIAWSGPVERLECILPSPPVWSMLLLLNVSLLRARPSLLTSASCHDLPRCRLMVDRKVFAYLPFPTQELRCPLDMPGAELCFGAGLKRGHSLRLTPCLPPMPKEA